MTMPATTATISNVPSKATMAAGQPGPQCGDQPGGRGPEHIGTWNMTWTAPADNGNGYVATYDLRWSATAITAGNFSSATPDHAASVPPRAAGQAESYTATGLPTGKTLYFAIKSADDSGNWSAISNVPSGSSR